MIVIISMNIRKTDLHLLMCFHALVSTGNVSKAAQLMNLSQPAMSNMLARLRLRFDDPLFVKTRNGVAPTARALEMIEPVRNTLASLSQIMESRCVFDPSTVTGRLTVTTTDHPEFVLAPKLVQRVERVAPRLNLEFRTANRELVNQWLESGEVDFRIAWLQKPPGDLHFKTLFKEQFVCMVRKDHPVVKSSLSLETYCSLRHIRVIPHTFAETAPAIDEAIAATGHRVRVSVIARGYLTVPFIVMRSNLIATLPVRIAKSFAKNLPLRILPPPVRLPELAITLFWHERTQHSPLHKWFRELASDVAGKL